MNVSSAMGSSFQRIIPPVQTWSVMEIGEMYDASNLLTPNVIHGKWHRIFTLNIKSAVSQWRASPLLRTLS